MLTISLTMDCNILLTSSLDMLQTSDTFPNCNSQVKVLSVFYILGNLLIPISSASACDGLNLSWFSTIINVPIRGISTTIISY